VKERLSIPEGLKGGVHFHTSAAHHLAMHRHEELELNLVTRGTGAYLLDNRKYLLRPRTLVWLFEGQNHLLLEQSPDFQMWIGVFSRRMLEECCTTEATQVLLKSNPPGAFCKPIPASDCAALDRFCSITFPPRPEPELYNAALGYFLMAAWSAYTRADLTLETSDVHPAVERAARLLRDRPELDDVDALAAEAGLSPSHLSRLFRRQIGEGLVEFRNRQRLERFLTIYGGGQRRTMLSAALKAGFGSYAQFHRVFRRSFGYSPGEHRRRMTAFDRPAP